MGTSLFAVQTSHLLTGPARALLAHLKSTPHFAVYWGNKFAVAQLKPARCILHGVRKQRSALWPELLTHAPERKSQILSWCKSVLSLRRDGASLRRGCTDWHLPCGSGAKPRMDLQRFQDKGKGTQPAMAGKRGAPQKAHISQGFCPGLLPCIQMWMSEWLLAAKLEMLCRDLLACYWHVTCLLACYHS